MTKHRTTRSRRLSPRSIPDNRRAAAPPEPAFDFNGTLYVLRDNLGRADTMVTCADELIVRLWSDGGQEIDDLPRRRSHVSFLMESASLAILTAIHACIELDLHRRDA
jgi:hypothetical protein